MVSRLTSAPPVALSGPVPPLPPLPVAASEAIVDRKYSPRRLLPAAEVLYKETLKSTIVREAFEDAKSTS